MKAHTGLGSLLLTVLSGSLLTGCSGGDDTSKSVDQAPAGAYVTELRSNESRIVPEAAEAAKAAQAEQAFGFALLQKLDEDSNLAFSPHSFSTAFAMATDAASGQTLAEIEQVLHFGTTDDAFHRSQDALQLALAKRNRDAIVGGDYESSADAQILTESNDLWLRDDAPPQASYLDTLARYYGLGVHHADFENHANEARIAINDKVSQDTRTLIPELIPQGLLDAFTVAVLTNALYLKAPWATPFQTAMPGDFWRLDGSKMSPDMLHIQTQLSYYTADGFAAVALPYYGGELEMLLIVPDPDRYDDVRSSLSGDVLSRLVSERTSELVDLKFPKFSVQSVIPALEKLKELGMSAPFAPSSAEFPKLTSPKFDQVYISDVLHQATVAIDEKGTEASAATAIVFSGVSSAIDPPLPPEPKVVVADHPFLFVIRDNPTGAVLFVGQVVAP